MDGGEASGAASGSGSGGIGAAGRGAGAAAGSEDLEAGGATSPGGAGPELDPIPPVGEPPVCPHGLALQAGSVLPISTAGDDLLQAITPDELSIAWKSGDRFLIADRAAAAAPFGAPLEVVGSSEYVAVTLSPDGLRLIGVRTDLSIVEQRRSAGAAFADAAPPAGDFRAFNATRASIPLGAQELSDLVLSADETSLFFSHFTADASVSASTVFESRRSGGEWQFASADLGGLLRAAAAKRRIPTGVSSDSLTLFYRDEVNGDFRMAWRINANVPFDHAEVLSPATGVQAAAPNKTCSRIYYSANASQGVDVLVATVGD